MYVSIRCHLQGVVPRRLWRFFLDTTHRGESAKQYYSGKWSNKKLRQLLIMNIHHIHCKRYVWDTLFFLRDIYLFLCLQVFGHHMPVTYLRVPITCPRHYFYTAHCVVMSPEGFLNLQHAAPSSKTKLSLSFHLSSSEVNRPKDLMF